MKQSEVMRMIARKQVGMLRRLRDGIGAALDLALEREVDYLLAGYFEADASPEVSEPEKPAEPLKVGDRVVVEGIDDCVFHGCHGKVSELGGNGLFGVAIDGQAHTYHYPRCNLHREREDGKPEVEAAVAAMPRAEPKVKFRVGQWAKHKTLGYGRVERVGMENDFMEILGPCGLVLAPASEFRPCKPEPKVEFQVGQWVQDSCQVPCKGVVVAGPDRKGIFAIKWATGSPKGITEKYYSPLKPCSPVCTAEQMSIGVGDKVRVDDVPVDAQGLPYDSDFAGRTGEIIEVRGRWNVGLQTSWGTKILSRWNISEIVERGPDGPGEKT